MRSSRAWWWLVMSLACAGCTRDLTIPDSNALRVELPFDAVAPRQRLQLSAAGGAGSGYTFAFAPNGKLSGESATLTSDGAYQAGERGLAQDVVRLTDASKNTVDVRIAVSAPLALSPAIASVAPGGAVRFVPSGGKPPYVLALLDGGALPASGDYVAAAPGNRVDVVQLTDATNDALASATAQVSVGAGLLLYPSQVALAPREQLAFVALGGQPPYRFSLVDAGSTGAAAATIEPSTGLYQAGSNDGASGATTGDVVQVTDANGQLVTAQVSVGPALTASLGTSIASPGAHLTITATGGKPPYAFAFQERGNRSRGSIDQTSGAYVAGRSTGAIDLLEVRDGTGSRFALPPITIGPEQFAIPEGGATQLVSGDFDGDGLPDIALLDTRTQHVIKLIRFAYGAPTVDFTSVPATEFVTQALVSEVSGDGIPDLLICGSYDVLPWLSRPGGRVEFVSSPDDGDAQFAHRHAATGDWVYRAGLNSCFGIERIDVRGDGGITAGQLVTTPRQECVVSVFNNTYAVTATPVGDAGQTAVGFTRYDTDGGGNVSASGPLEFRYLAPGSPVVINRSAQLPLPASHRLYNATRRFQVTNGVDTLLDDPSRVGADRLYAVLAASDGGSALWGVDVSVPAQVLAPVPIPTVFPTSGLAASLQGNAQPLFAAWDQLSGVVPILALQADGGATLNQRIELPYRVSSATFADLDFDGLEDLVVSSYSRASLDVLYGDGNGSFGRLPRFSLDAVEFGQSADLDGDGATDLVATDGDGLQLFWAVPGTRQLAVGPRSPMGRLPSRPTLDDFTGDGVPDVMFFDELGRLVLAPGSRQGTFGPAQPLLNPAGGTDPTPSSRLFTVNFGGAAPGPDLLATVRDPATQALQLVVFVRTGPTTAVKLTKSAPASALARFCVYFASDYDGVGELDAFAACAVGNVTSTQVFVAPSSGAGATLSFGAWQPVTSTFPGRPLEFIATPGFNARYVNLSSSLLEITSGGGSVQATAQPLPTTYLPPMLAAPLRPGSQKPEFVGLADDGVRVETSIVSWNGSSWQPSQRLQLGTAYGWTTLRFSANGPVDVLFARGTDRYSVLQNDGTGQLR